MREVTCTFADRTTHALPDLARVHEELCQVPPAPATLGFLLHTCHRFEWYAVGAPPPLPQLAGRPPMFGEPAALSRLTQIAAGTRSMVPGEVHILAQVRAAIANLVVSHPLYGMGHRAVALAERVRREFALRPALDYRDLPRYLLGNTSAAASQLVVVGGGMLARSVAASPPSTYQRVLVVSRAPKKLRRALGPDSGVAVTSPHSAVSAVAAGDFDTVIATTGLTAQHVEFVRSLVTDSRCRSVLDLCGTPALEDRPGKYIHLHDPQVLALLSYANRLTTKRADLAKTYIDELVGARA